MSPIQHRRTVHGHTYRTEWYRQGREKEKEAKDEPSSGNNKLDTPHKPLACPTETKNSYKRYRDGWRASKVRGAIVNSLHEHFAFFGGARPSPTPSESSHLVAGTA